ncbi:MAG: shikimate dehydrogenase family protein [Sphingobacterium sp.]|uniref:shikimate dehydrogenase family protein n=1 Tax=Sphingobacterium sp. JB170 TaxID=1434842 RepID=UPI00097EC589|nr:shikimate dehydrogenase [Sphingobacterium sp. JB170]SJN41957.1 Shikimate 5-dehydrogenase I alpha [Sphingobacterium sp. JB170]
MKKLGLIGFPLGHSFSKKYYLDKFEQENIKGIDYNLYSIEHIEQFPNLYKNDDSFYGFNVTIPHKQSVIAYMNELSPEAEKIGAVNCIKLTKKGDKPFLIGFNTDAYGFEESLKPMLNENHKTALVLGNGGAAKAVHYTLEKLGCSYKIVSRKRETGDITYQELDQQLIAEHKLIINCSPVGTFPNVDDAPNIPYQGIGPQHLLYDLIYNPEETAFLKQGRQRGAQIKNGYDMLLLQAEKNWKIWNEDQAAM